MEQVELYKECLHTCPHLKEKILTQAQENDEISVQDMAALIEEAAKVKGC